MVNQPHIVLEEKLRYAINFCKSIDTDDYAHVNLQEGMMMGEEEDDNVWETFV